MDKKAFIEQYIIAFTAAYAANTYDDNCARGWRNKPIQYVEDAAQLAEDAWDEYQALGKSV